MDARQHRALEAFERVRDFVNDLSAAGVLSADDEQRRALDALIERVREVAASLDRMRRGGPAEARQARQLRRQLASDHVLPVTRVARTVLFPVDVDEGLLRPPTRRLTPSALVATATALADAVTPHRALFLEAGLPEDFVDRLRMAADRYRAAIETRSRGRKERAAAAARLREDLGRGRVLLGRIDATLTLLLRDDRIRLAEWRRVKRARRGARGPEEDAGLLSIDTLAHFTTPKGMSM